MGDVPYCNDGTATAFKAWDCRWSTEEGRAEWMTAEKDVSEFAGELKKRAATNILDLGCGVGRHSLFLASLGFRVFAADASPKALEFTANAASEAGFAIDMRQSHMTELPFDDGFFDYVLAWNVIYHGTRDIVGKSISEIKRVLRTGGIFQGTMLSKRDSYYGIGSRIDADTFVAEVDDDEKRHPHFYCNAEELVSIFKGFEIISLRLCEQKRPGSFHWNIIMEKISDETSNCKESVMRS